MGLKYVKTEIAKTARVGRALGLGVALAALVSLTGASIAQSVPDNAVPKNNLDLPSNPQVFGKVDPNVRKPTALVNGAVITGTDVDQRVALLVAARDLKLNPTEMAQYKLLITRQLIDETLEIQQARTAEVKIAPEEITKTYDSIVARNFGRTPAEMRTYLRTIGSSERSLKRQIEAELSWNKYLRRKVDVNVGDEEVKAIIKKLTDAQGTTEYHVREIYLKADADRAQEVFNQGKQMIESIQKREKGEDTFGYYARGFSAATTAATEGDLDWLSETQLAQLPPSLVEAIKSMTPEHLAGPIEVPGGFSIIYLVETRKIGVADPLDATLTLKQVSVRFPDGISQAQADIRVADFSKATQAIRGCGEVAKVASSLGAEVVDNASVQIRQLPGALRDIMLKLQVGEASPPFGSVKDGIRTLVLCGRDEARGGNLPGLEQMRGQMESQRTNLRANQLLRDLRRDAIVEYR
ncbi:peptidylprolyl isomerase [Sphingomonas sp. HMP6]|uniref:peptidylprolyl isomerase n=1 Tax=Sphingomonas sp. HMP6 TaxID=1517551 RepID=UPI001596F7A7|nr:peptidylprolyl isomerase [Sphingomonas sp. HMP6]BCA58237.1 peptidylprolyl isomerase [Sphingomonas sp. HMP6]